MGAWGELGALDQAKVRQIFERLWQGEMESCRKKSNEFVAGDISVRVRINHAGGVKWAFFTSSTLGDRNVEKCILDALKSATWPIPVGGDDGIAEQELPFADLADRPALPWAAENVSATLSSAAAKFGACKARGRFTATVIVRTDGTVLSAGAYGPDENAEDAVDCISRTLQTLRFPKPGSWTAKASFPIP